MTNETKQAKWTPGDWEVSQTDQSSPNDVDIYSEEGDYVASVVLDGDTSRRDANAYLIAAAPTLYEALDKLASAVLLHLTLNPSEITNAFNAAQIALAKANGPAVGHTDAF